MIGNIGFFELLVIAAAGLLVFGPDRLPKAVRDTSQMIRKMRQLARGAMASVKTELGPEFADMDIASLHPRRLADSILNDD